MAHSFKVGDRVVIVRSDVSDRVGQVVTVVSGLVSSFCNKMNRVHNAAHCWCPEGNPPVHLLGAVSRVAPGRLIAYPPSHLEPYRPDGSERGEWTAELRKLCGVREDA